MKEQKCDAQKLKVGDYLSRTSYMKVLGTMGSTLAVQNETKVQWEISKSIVEAECFTAHQYEEEVKVTRTELAAIFASTGDKVYKVSFNKMPQVEKVFDKIANKGKLPTNKEMKAQLAAGMKGEERVLIGYTISVENGLGRSLVVDLEKEQDPNKSYSTVQSQVDHRSLNWLIFANKKYIWKDYKEPKA